MIAIAVFVVFLVIGMPIAICLGLFGTAHVLSMGNDAFIQVIIGRMFSGVNNFSISCIPFFIMAGELMNGGGITRRLLGFLRELIGRVRGGMAYTTVALSAILAAILGSAQANASLLNQILPKELAKDGYDPAYSGALISAASVLGPIIPPSTMFIFYCYLTDVSIKYMFIAGIVPGVVLALAYALTIALNVRKMNISRPEGKFSLKRFGLAFIKAIPALLVPTIILGGVLSGIFTATESGAVACVFAFLAGLVYRELKLKDLPNMMLRTAISTGAIFLIIAFGNIIAWSMAMDGIPELLISAIMALTTNKYVIILLILILLALVGCVLDMASATLVFLPVMFPITQMIGMDAVHFGIIFSMMITIGMITPPVGQVLFITCNVSGISFRDLCGKIGPFVITSFVTTAALSYLPDIVLWLPKIFNYVVA